MTNKHALSFTLFALVTLAAACALAAEPAEEAPSFDALLTAASTYEYGHGRAPLFALAQAVQKDALVPERRELMASKMTAALASDATLDCKKFLCERISLVGSGKQVPALASFLADEDLGLAARSALERIPGKDAITALRDALSKSSGRVALGLMDTLGKRDDRESVAVIAGFVGDADPVVGAGAAVALGKIGGKESAEQLLKADAAVGGEVRVAVSLALLQCADRLRAAGEGALAAEAYKRLSEPDRPAHVKLAAFPGLIASRKGDGAALVLDALSGEDAAMRTAAIRSLRTFGGRELIVAVAGQLAELAPEAQVQIVNALADRGDGAALPGIGGLLGSSDRVEVKSAAVAALGRLGDAATVDLLAGLLSDAELGSTAARSLARIEGPGVEAAIIKVLQGGDATRKAGVAAVLRQRGATGAAPALMQAAVDEDAGVRKAALRALGTLATASDCDGLIRLLERAAGGDARGIQTALVALCARHDAAGNAVARSAAGASGPTRTALLSILGKTGGGGALRVLKTALKDSDKDVRTTAVKAITEWPDAEPLPELVALLRTEKEVAPKALAFRAFVGLSARGTSGSPDETAELYEAVIALADRPEDKKTVVGGLGNVPSPTTLKLAVACLGDDRTVNEAAFAVARIAPHLLASHTREVKAAAEAVLDACKLETARAKAREILFQLSKPVNLARSATASSPDGLDKDGNAGGDQAAIDGNPNTYWDEVDGRKLYILKLDFKRAVTAAGLSVMGYQHHGYAPRDFEIVCDGKKVKTVKDARYGNNRLLVGIPSTTFKSLEIKITRSYGPSPAIRELELYGEGDGENK